MAVSSGMMRLPSVAPWWRQIEHSTAIVGSRMRLLRGLDRRRNAPALAREFFVLLLPLGRTVRRRNLHRGHLVFGAVGCPIGVLGGDDVGLRVRVMECRVDHAGRDA